MVRIISQRQILVCENILVSDSDPKHSTAEPCQTVARVSEEKIHINITNIRIRCQLVTDDDDEL